MKKKANIGFTVLIALIIVCCGAAVLSIAGNSKYNAKTEYQRIEDRYIAESGVDLSVSLFLNYLSLNFSLKSSFHYFQSISMIY